MKFIIASLAISIIAFLVGAYASGWSIIDDAPYAWIIVCALAGVVGALRLLGNDSSRQIPNTTNE